MNLPALYWSNSMSQALYLFGVRCFRALRSLALRIVRKQFDISILRLVVGSQEIFLVA